MFPLGRPAIALLVLSAALPSQARAAGSGSASFRNSASSVDSGGARKTSTSYRGDSSQGAVSAPAAGSASFSGRDGFMAVAYRPARITDLWVSSTAATSEVYLQWTAPGNDGDEASAAGSFTIKYTSIAVNSPALSDANFTAAPAVAGAPAPGPRGTRHTLIIGSLQEGVTYFFAIEAGERDGIRSALSGGATAQTAAPLGCVAVRNVDQVNGPHTTIQSAVDALPAALSGHSCVIVRDGATYPEQVTVRNFINNGSSITILADSASGLRPVVSPPALSTAAFLIANASVNIQGLDIVPASAMNWGVRASSAQVALSSVNIQDAGGLIAFAGVELSSRSAVFYSSVTVANAHGVYLRESAQTTIAYSTVEAVGAAANPLSAIYFSAGSSSNSLVRVRAFINEGVALDLRSDSNGNSVSFSTMVNNGGGCGFVPCPAVNLENARFNSIASSYLEGALLAVLFHQGANLNTVANSTVAVGAAGAGAIAVSDSSSNTFVAGYVLARNGYGVHLDEGASHNVLAQSTVTSFGAGACTYGDCSAILIQGATNTVTLSYAQGAIAVIVSGSTGTAISGSVLAATDDAGAALFQTGGSAGLTIATSTLFSTALGRGLALQEGNAGVVTVGSVTFTGSARAIEVSTQAAGFVLAIDSVTFRGLASGATAIHFLGGTFVSTITLAGFEDASVRVNVAGAALALASRVTMRASRGGRQGPAYENDPNALVDWADLLAPDATSLWFVGLSSAGVQYDLVGADGYTLAVSTAADFTGALISSTVVGAQGLLTASGLDPNTTYYLRTGALWGASTVYAQSVLSTATLSRLVSGTTVFEIHASSVVVNWLPLAAAPPDASSNSASGYVLEVSTRSDFLALWTSSATSGVSLSTLAAGGLLGGDTYYFRVGSLNWNGAPHYAGAVSTWMPVSGSTPPVTRAAQPPFGLALSSAGASVTLTWMPVQRFDDGAPFGDPAAATAAELTGYRVYRATTVVAGVWTQQVEVSSSVLTWIDAAGGPQYFYHVRAVNGSSVSGRSVLRSVGTLSAFAVAPDDLSYLEVTASGVSAIEGVGGQAMTAYLVEASSRPQDLAGRVVKSVEFSAKQGGLAEATNFELPGMGRLKLRYELGVSSVVASGAPASAPATPSNLGVFWYNGSRWVQMYGRLDELDQTLNLETKYLGIYQLRVVERAAGFSFDQAGVSNRFVTPNGDGRNDSVVFVYDNPRAVSVRGRILDLRGRVIVSELPAGPATNSRAWDGRGAGGYVPGGVYFYQLEAEGKVFSGSIVILK